MFERKVLQTICGPKMLQFDVGHSYVFYLLKDRKRSFASKEFVFEVDLPIGLLLDQFDQQSKYASDLLLSFKPKKFNRTTQNRGRTNGNTFFFLQKITFSPIKKSNSSRIAIIKLYKTKFFHKSLLRTLEVEMTLFYQISVNSKFSPIQRHENIQQYTTIR
jgi:hypothetical protein